MYILIDPKINIYISYMKIYFYQKLHNKSFKMPKSIKLNEKQFIHVGNVTVL